MSFFLRSPRLALAGAFAMAGFAATALPAQAQLFGYWGARTFSYAPAYPQMVHPSELPGIVADEGMRLVGRPFRNGNVYVADAIDRRGWRHRLIIDAFSGDIVQSFGSGQLVPPNTPAPAAPRRSLARIIPVEPEVIPGIDRPLTERGRPVPKPKAEKKVPELARAPVEARPLPVPDVNPVLPKSPAAVEAPTKPQKKPPVVARTPVESKPLEAPPVKKVVPQVLPGYQPPAPFESESKRVEPRVVPAPVAIAPAKPAVNDVPVAPLYDAPAKAPAGKVNDVPVAPLD